MAKAGVATRETKGRSRGDHQERKAVCLGSSRCVRKPWVLALKAEPDEAPDPMGDRETAIRWQFQEHSTKHWVPTSREEVTENMEKEQVTAFWT